MNHIHTNERIRFRHGRLTPARKAIFAYIEKKQGMFCAADVVKALTHIDRVSIYRTLDLLATEDIIHKTVQLSGHQYYEYHTRGKGHHHHAICTYCLKNACVPCALPQKQVAGFESFHHDVSFTGTCVSCAR